MLKLNASYSKKVPADTEYSSQSYHASVEVELPDGLTPEQLNAKIRETFALVRDSVETELHNEPSNVQNSNVPPLPIPPRTAAAEQGRIQQDRQTLGYARVSEADQVSARPRQTVRRFPGSAESPIQCPRARKPHEDAVQPCH